MNLYGLTREKLENYFLSINEKKFKALQVFEWIYDKRIKSLDECSNIKKEIILKMKEDLSLELPKLITRQVEEETEKYLFELSDKEHVEAVLMKHNYGTSVCVSSQVGCNMGCKFCESGRLKKRRNLEVHEMVGQLLKIEEETKTRISSVVVMGIGEPFDNYDNLIDFIKIINDAKGLAIGARHITVSTCGIVPKIYDFSNFPLQVNLAISLHAPNNELRNKLMPINKAYPMDILKKAIEEYIEKTNRRVTIEYIMLKDVNDNLACAKELCEYLKGLNVYVNLIPYNETSHIEYLRSSKDAIDSFYTYLNNHNIQVTVRREFGSKISAACGQLRSEIEK